jgi:hypothetical protein
MTMAIKKKTKSKRRKRNKTRRMQSINMVECCICRKNTDITKTLMPRKCLNKHGVSAHRICPKCWWDKKTGFALEEGDHACVGCTKGLPLNTNKNPGEIIDISD